MLYGWYIGDVCEFGTGSGLFCVKSGSPESPESLACCLKSSKPTTSPLLTISFSTALSVSAILGTPATDLTFVSAVVLTLVASGQQHWFVAGHLLVVSSAYDLQDFICEIVELALDLLFLLLEHMTCGSHYRALWKRIVKFGDVGCWR